MHCFWSNIPWRPWLQQFCKGVGSRCRGKLCFPNLWPLDLFLSSTWFRWGTETQLRNWSCAPWFRNLRSPIQSVTSQPVSYNVNLYLVGFGFGELSTHGLAIFHSKIHILGRAFFDFFMIVTFKRHLSHREHKGSSVFPRCTLPQSRDEPMPAGVTSCVLLHVCSIFSTSLGGRVPVPRFILNSAYRRPCAIL